MYVYSVSFNIFTVYHFLFSIMITFIIYILYCMLIISYIHSVPDVYINLFDTTVSLNRTTCRFGISINIKLFLHILLIVVVFCIFNTFYQ